jgi:hemoglobin
MKKALLTLLALTILISSFDADAGRRKRRRRRSREPKVIAEKILFERLGGRKTWDMIVGDFAAGCAKDPILGPRIASTSGLSAKLKTHIAEDLCEGARGPCRAAPDKAKSALQALAPDEDSVLAVGGHLLDSLEKNKVPEREKNEVMALLGEMNLDEEDDSPSDSPN